MNPDVFFWFNSLAITTGKHSPRLEGLAFGPCRLTSILRAADRPTIRAPFLDLLLAATLTSDSIHHVWRLMLQLLARTSGVDARGARILTFFHVLFAFFCQTCQVADAQIYLQNPDSNQSITIQAQNASRWEEGAYEVLCIDGPCEIQQGSRVIGGHHAVIWIERAEPFSFKAHKLIAYVDGVIISEGGTGSVRVESNSWLDRLYTHQPLKIEIKDVQPGTPQKHWELYDAAMRARVPTPPANSLSSPANPSSNPGSKAAAIPGFAEPVSTATNQQSSTPQNPAGVQQAQFTAPVAPPAFGGAGLAQPPAGDSLVPSRIRVFPRSNVKIHSDSFMSPDGSEQITVVPTGVNVILEGVSNLGPIDIATDRLVVWSPPGGPSIEQSGAADGALELYMEGNIVLRQADRVIYASAMYYNVRQQLGTVLNAELLTSVEGFPGIVRLKADVLRQIDDSRFHAHQAALTSSRLGVPRYWFQSGDLLFEQKSTPVVDPVTGIPLLDPNTGRPATTKEQNVESRNNVVYLGEIPVFYWPRLATDFTRPTNYVDRVFVKNDNVLGTQFGVGFNLKQLTGIGANNPGVDWSGSLHYLSERGFGFGSTLDYVLPQFFGLPGEARGFADAWFIDENGLDNLGADRRALVPEEDFRGRAIWQHRQRLNNGLQVTAEVGWISDRNFLEQYYEREWDGWKDQSTGIEFKYLTETGSWNASADVRLNDFFTQTQSIRFDHFELGRSLFRDRFTWFGHNQVGYYDLETASTPEDPADAATFALLPWEVESNGIRVGGRHEIDAPVQLGAVKAVPYVLGEVMHWGEDVLGQSNTRLLGQAGVRASLPMWTVDPNVRDTLFNLNGLAHKVVWESEFLWADASDNLDEFPLYDQLDDDSQEHFRRRFAFENFGGLTPEMFDERLYALRSGLQSWVTSPATEIADDLMLLRVGVRQRWQTKRGLPGRERVVDFMTLDTEATWFPDAGDDNFGEDFGMINYDWRWHLGDRLTLMSDGYLDTFGDGLSIFTFGGYISRPERGSAYLGFRSIEGPISSNVLHAAINYRMSHKWIASISSSVDFSDAGNIGQTFELTRIGESFLVSLGLRVDESRDNVGVGISVEPRVIPLSYRGRLGGVAIPPVGAYGLE